MLHTALLTLTLLAAPGAEASKPATNGRCPVLGNPVADRNQAVALHGRKYYVCCGECESQLTASPDKFLTEDGTPKNSTSAQSGGKVRDHY